MEKDTPPQFLHQNLVTIKKYAALFNVHPKTVYDWINTGRVDEIEFADLKFLDCTVKPRPSEKQLAKLLKVA